MNSDNRDKFKEVVKSIGPVDQLSIEQLVSRNLFELVSFDVETNMCNKFSHHDYEHSSACKYCQRKMLLYYLGKCMEKLADDGRLPQFNEAHLSPARICDRTYQYIRFGSELIFRIDRHLNAWRDEARMKVITQNWTFDFADLSLELPYGVSTIGISVRRLMESKSEWKGTAPQLLAELKKIAEVLKINTKSGLWPKSSYKLNLTLQELKQYLEKFGITTEKQRYIF